MRTCSRIMTRNSTIENTFSLAMWVSDVAPWALAQSRGISCPVEESDGIWWVVMDRKIGPMGRGSGSAMELVVKRKLRFRQSGSRRYWIL